MHVLLLIEPGTGEVLAVCRTIMGVATACIRERGEIGTLSGHAATIDALNAAIGEGDVQLDFPDGASLTVRRFPLDQ